LYATGDLGIRLTGKRSINKALDRALSEDHRVVLVGEDLSFGYTCFGCEDNLAKRYPSQVISTPISEAGFTGLGTGLALGGYKPIVTYMFMDFALLAMDQIINHAMLLHADYKPLPILYRATIGIAEYGPVHSRDWASLFVEAGIDVIYPESAELYYNTLLGTIRSLNRPTLFVERKDLYNVICEVNEKDINHR
jgi:pyruvate/2-oxoglutarate/acetoin dehydrogenase E1 component